MPTDQRSRTSGLSVNLRSRQVCEEPWEDPRVRLLMTIAGVDYCVASTLIAALGDLSRFADGDHTAGCLWLTPSIKHSANKCCQSPSEVTPTQGGCPRRRPGRTEYGSSPPTARPFFSPTGQRVCWNIALCAAARKLVTIAWLILKSNEPYCCANRLRRIKKLSRLPVAVTGKHRMPERTGVKDAAKFAVPTGASIGEVCENSPPLRATATWRAAGFKSLGVDHIDQSSS